MTKTTIATAHRPASIKPKKRPTSSNVPRLIQDADKLPPPAAAAFENIQLTLFQTFLANTDDERDSLSNAMDLWDSVPRYSLSRQAMTKTRVNGEFLRRHELTFQHRQEMYTRIVSPARIKDADGIDRDYYPSASEELIEDALRKIATEQQAGYFDKPNYRSGVTFTLHQLREELKRRGHSRSYQQIVQSLTILSHSIIEIKPHREGESSIVSAYFPSLLAVSRSKLAEDPKSRWLAQFHPLVTGAIDDLTYRQYNYRLMMSHKTQLARWLHKQLILKFTFASFSAPFEMRFSTVKRDSGLLEEYGRNRDAVDALNAAFEELKERAVILSFKRVDVNGPRKAILDAVFTVAPNVDFVQQTKAANRRQKDAEMVVIGRGSHPPVKTPDGFRR
jgi:hypothetical protein